MANMQTLWHGTFVIAIFWLDQAMHLHCNQNQGLKVDMQKTPKTERAER